MKVYRAISEKDFEIKKYLESMILLQKSPNMSEGINCFNEHLIGINTFFDRKERCKYFFFYAEDAFRYRYRENSCYAFYIAEYDIPKELLTSNMGLGIYSSINGDDYHLAIEFAIPFEELQNYENVSSKNPCYYSNFITGNVSKIPRFAYHDDKMSLIDNQMRRESYQNREIYINYLQQGFVIQKNSIRPYFEKALSKSNDEESEKKRKF